MKRENKTIIIIKDNDLQNCNNDFRLTGPSSRPVIHGGESYFSPFSISRSINLPSMTDPVPPLEIDVLTNKTMVLDELTRNASNMEFKSFIDEFGFVKLKNALPLHNIEMFNREIDALQSEPYDATREDVFYEGNTKLVKQIQYLHEKSRIFMSLTEYFVPTTVKKIYGKDIEYSILNMQLFEKFPKVSKPTRSHQDNAYFKLKGKLQPITIWISLDDIDEENGCIYYLPQSHKKGTLQHDRYSKFTTFRIRSGVPGLSLCLPQTYDRQQIPIYTQPGDVLVHFGNTIHMAGANTSENRRRRAIGIVVIPTCCKPDENLVEWHKKMLQEDIELQNNKDKLASKYL
jgi:phytanoyl-CoA hydroxylase